MWEGQWKCIYILYCTIATSYKTEQSLSWTQLYSDCFHQWTINTERFSNNTRVHAYLRSISPHQRNTSAHWYQWSGALHITLIYQKACPRNTNLPIKENYTEIDLVVYSTMNHSSRNHLVSNTFFVWIMFVFWWVCGLHKRKLYQDQGRIFHLLHLTLAKSAG